MPAITGITTKKNKHRQLTHIIVDVRRHPQAVTALKELGLVPKTPLEIEAEDCLTVDEVFGRLETKIKQHYANNSNQTLR